MTRVLFAGGRGFIGSAAIEAFLATAPAETEVLCMTREPKWPCPGGGRVKAVKGNVTDEGSLAPVVEGVDIVVHSIQFPNHPVENPKKGWTYENVDGWGTARLAAVAARAGVKRYVYLSGAGTAEGRKEPWFRAKLRAEEAVRTHFPDHVIFRPSWVYGPGDRSMNRFVFFTKYLPFVPMIGNGAERVQPVYVKDLAQVVAKAALGTGSGTYEIGCRDAVPMWLILEIVQKVLDRWRPIVPHPVWFMKLVARAMQVLPRPSLSPSAIDFVRMECPVDPTRAEKDFSIRFRPLDEGLRDYLRP